MNSRQIGSFIMLLKYYGLNSEADEIRRAFDYLNAIVDSAEGLIRKKDQLPRDPDHPCPENERGKLWFTSGMDCRTAARGAH